MEELTSDGVPSTPAASGAYAAAPRSEPWTEAEPLVRVLDGKGSLAAGVGGVAAIALTTVVARWLEVPALYERSRDLVLHLSLEVLCGTVLWGALWGAANGLVLAERRLIAKGFFRLRALALVLAGLAAGAYVFFEVVRPSAHSLVAPPAVWATALAVLGVAAAWGAHLALHVRIGHRRLVGTSMVAMALGLHVVGLERYVRHYGNLQTLLLGTVDALAALGTGLALGRHRVGSVVRHLARVTVAASALAVLALGQSPSYSARRAVLVWGGIAKRTLLSVVWPLADRDHDGSPSAFWGVDPDDHRSDVTPRTGLPPWPAPTREALGVPLSHGPRRNLLWITIDTARADSFERALVEDARVRDAFASFARYQNYVSCSSRTSEVMAQLLGDGRCDPRSVEGISGHSLLALLHGAGYHQRLLGFIEEGLRFDVSEVIPDDARLLAAASKVIATTAGHEALFVHLRGGHADYLAPGATLRERYENQLRASFVAVAELVRAAPADRWAVVVVGDHGEAFGEHLSKAHASTLYEEALHTPLAIRGPEVAAGSRGERLSCDTVTWRTLHAAGVLSREPEPLPYQYAALDIAAGELGHLQGDRLRALRIGAHKAVWSSDLGLWELYDLETDPRELVSLAGTRPLELAPLREKLELLSRECPAPIQRATSDH